MTINTINKLLVSLIMALSCQFVHGMESHNIKTRKALQKYGIDLDSAIKQMGFNPKEVNIEHYFSFAHLPWGWASTIEKQVTLLLPFPWRIKPSFHLDRQSAKLSFEILPINLAKTASMIAFTLCHELAHLTPYNSFLQRIQFWLHTPDIIDEIDPDHSNPNIHYCCTRLWDCRRKLSYLISRMSEKHADLTATRKLSCVDGGIKLFKRSPQQGTMLDPFHPTSEQRIAYLTKFKETQDLIHKNYNDLRFWTE